MAEVSLLGDCTIAERIVPQLGDCTIAEQIVSLLGDCTIAERIVPLLGDCSLASEAGDVAAMRSSRVNGGYLVAQD